MKSIIILFSHNWFLAVVVFMASLICTSYAHAAPDDESAMLTPSFTVSDIVVNVFDTGLFPGNIREISKPEFIDVINAGLNMNDNEPVFVTNFPNGPAIYPQSIVVWHEVINEAIGSRNYMLTYAPITGTLAAYIGSVERHASYFGVDGRLIFGNSILFDRISGSRWVQLAGVAFEGPYTGNKLERLPVIWTTWKEAKANWPNARVLVKPTNVRRTYGRDPYGSYFKTDSYYQNDRLVHTVPSVDNRLHLKQRVVAATVANRQFAIDPVKMAEHKIINFREGKRELVAIYDPAISTVRVFDRIKEDGITVTLMFREGELIDRETGTRWNYDGTPKQFAPVVVGGATVDEDDAGTDEDKEELNPVLGLTEIPTVTTMWFSWQAFFPSTSLYPQDLKWLEDAGLEE